MYDRDTSPDFWRLSTQQHVSLENHRQMIENILRWHEACALAGEEQKATAQPLRTRLADLLYLVMNTIRGKEQQVHHHRSGEMDANCPA
jgi:hypothetical protein